ncbi:hypothetical protein OESDEN_09101 [Oesophagostomum dentatum]|uniref:Nudix hydrolase domain-containing protein n=1 Tax=Oesophagostomum dentatum TaxID=61180 RepID=A0A0B1T6M4_OESDE|nr:hypothetical protein OESDEN_09101 [Oesophagostomum dentatum]
MQRGSTAKFMPNAVVFPGGVATPEDKDLGPPTKIAALRELFEETGLLIGQKETVATSKELEDLQEKTKEDPTFFRHACPSPPVNQLVEWNTWLTPSSYKQRYMTSFFLVDVDGEPEVKMCEKEMITISGEPEVKMCEKEMIHYSWSDPKDCLRKGRAGEVILPPPQVYELTRIAQTPCEQLRFCGNNVHVFCPQLIFWPHKEMISNVLPGDHLYIENDSFNQPTRNMTAEELRVDQDKPIHREEYKPQPLYGMCKLYMHNLSKKYAETLHQFEPDLDKL